MSDLLTKSLAYRDPTILRGRTADGLVLGMIGMRGRCQRWPGGGYVLKRGTSRADITDIVGAAGPAATSIREFPFVSHAAGTTYCYQVVPVGPGGVEAVVPAAGDQVVTVPVGDDGVPLEPLPAAPRDLAAAAIAGGMFRLSWISTHNSRRPAAATFAVYSDNGTGVVDWETPLHTMRAGIAPRAMSWQSAAFAHGAVVQFAVRAVAATGAAERNTTAVAATADAEGPAAGQISSATILGDE